MKVHHLNCGTFRPVGRWFVNGTGTPWARGRLVCHCLVVETGSGLVLVDAGLGTEDLAEPARRLGLVFVLAARPALDPAETAIARVRALSLDPRDVRHVVLTHLDLDHAGGLADFPWATVHVLAAEHRAATALPGFRDRRRYRPCQWAHGPKWSLHDAEGEAWEGFASARRLEGLPPEILLVPLPGHSRGHAGVAVRTASGWILHAGDAYVHHGQLDPARPSIPLALSGFERFIAFDGPERRRNMERLRELATRPDPGVRILCTHDPHYLEPEPTS